MEFKNLDEVEFFLTDYLIVNRQSKWSYHVLSRFMEKVRELGWDFLNTSGLMTDEAVMIMFTLFIAGYRNGQSDWG